MDKYYHFTSINNLGNIQKYGLVPKKGFRAYTINDDQCGVFLSKGIDKSIQMLAFMYNYYNKMFGYEGNIEIQKCLNDIQRLQMSQNFSYKEEIDEYYSIIKKINMIKSCRDFNVYLGGYCCFLSITGIETVFERSSNDCLYNDIISPSQINLVNIKPKDINSYIYGLYEVLSYFMSIYSMTKVSKDINGNYNDIMNFYKYIYESGYAHYNQKNSDLVEIPLTNYNFSYQKTLTIF